MSAPGQVEIPRLLVSDFDLTQADTKTPSPHDVNVENAYGRAIRNVLGFAALKKYGDQGGHLNRAPSEIVAAVSDLSGEDLQEYTKAVVQSKLSYLLGEIGAQQPDGTIWPAPIPGFIDAWRAIRESKEDGNNIFTATLSSGHTEFIRKTFEVWGEPLPNILVTDDTLKTLHDSHGARYAVKPDPALMHLAWEFMQQQCDQRMPLQGLQEQTVMVGDDPKKDGELAKESGTAFVLITNEHPAEDWQRAVEVLGGLANTEARRVTA